MSETTAPKEVLELVTLVRLRELVWEACSDLDGEVTEKAVADFLGAFLSEEWCDVGAREIGGEVRYPAQATSYLVYAFYAMRCGASFRLIGAMTRASDEIHGLIVDLKRNYDLLSEEEEEEEEEEG